MPKGIPKKVHLYKLVYEYVGEFESFRKADMHITNGDKDAGQHVANAVKRNGYTKGHYATLERIHGI